MFLVIPPSMYKHLDLRAVARGLILITIGMCLALALVWAGLMAADKEAAKYDAIRAQRLAECNAHPWPKPAACAIFSLQQTSNIED